MPSESLANASGHGRTIVRTVQDILNKKGSDVVAISKDASVLEAARMMSDHQFGALVVLDADQVVGIVSERDVLNRVIATEKAPSTTRVHEIMTSPCACGKLQTTLDECRDVMTAKRIRHVPIVEGGRLCGLVSIGDVVAAEAEIRDTTIEYLHQYLYGRT
jgi:CBS domain-containing protein